MRLRLPDPSSARRLAAFLHSLGVGTTAYASTVLELEEDVDRTELAIYLRVWDVLHPDAVVRPDD